MLCGVLWRYCRPDLPPVIPNLSLEIAPGEKIGVVGRTGAGKSSLFQALFRIVEPSGGCVEFDGEDIATYGLQDVRRSLSIIPQVHCTPACACTSLFPCPMCSCARILCYSLARCDSTWTRSASLVTRHCGKCVLAAVSRDACRDVLPFSPYLRPLGLFQPYLQASQLPSRTAVCLSIGPIGQSFTVL